MSSCQNCSSQISNAHKDSLDSEHPLGPLDPLNEASLRIRELELELAQAKLDKVEAECRSQDLNHQLVSTLSELHGNKSMGKDKDNTSWQPSWMSKTLNSIQEKVKKDSQNIPSFQSYTSDITQVRIYKTYLIVKCYHCFTFIKKVKPREVALPAKMLATRNSINVINYSPTQTTTTLSASSGGSPLKTNTTHYNELN